MHERTSLESATKNMLSQKLWFLNHHKVEQQHFNKKGHGIKDMYFLPIERVLPAGDTGLRKTRESVWIRQYDSVNFGNNART